LELTSINDVYNINVFAGEIRGKDFFHLVMSQQFQECCKG